jgi:hypothetical protein
MSAGTLRDLAGRVGRVHGHPRQASSEVQGVAAGDRISGTGSVGLPEWFDKPGREVQRHVSMRVSVLGDRFPGPG